MPLKHWGELPVDVQLIQGERGGLYYMRNGERVYVSTNPTPKSKKYRAPKRGAYARYLANIKQL